MCRLSVKATSAMELVFMAQILIALSVLYLFINIMLTIMLCGTYYCSKPAWEKLKDEEMELGSRVMPVPEEDEAILI